MISSDPGGNDPRCGPLIAPCPSPVLAALSPAAVCGGTSPPTITTTVVSSSGGGLPDACPQGAGAGRGAHPCGRSRARASASVSSHSHRAAPAEPRPPVTAVRASWIAMTSRLRCPQTCSVVWEDRADEDVRVRADGHRVPGELHGLPPHVAQLVRRRSSISPGSSCSMRNYGACAIAARIAPRVSMSDATARSKPPRGSDRAGHGPPRPSPALSTTSGAPVLLTPPSRGHDQTCGRFSSRE